MKSEEAVNPPEEQAVVDVVEGGDCEGDALAVPGVDPAWTTQEGGLRLRPDYWPGLGGMDGFYIACLRKDA